MLCECNFSLAAIFVLDLDGSLSCKSHPLYPPVRSVVSPMFTYKKIFSWITWATVAFFGSAAPSLGQSLQVQEFPEYARVRSIIEARLLAQPDFRRSDLISRGDVASALREVEALGWKDVSRSEVISQMLDDGEFLVRELRSPQGRTFMRRVADYRLIYDRLDRVSRAPGGHALIHDLIKLPDGHRYARMETPPGVPSLTDLLPKGLSGKTPRIKDLDKPTGRVYTLDELLRRLETSHRHLQQTAQKR